jgi:hypothetical protein
MKILLTPEPYIVQGSIIYGGSIFLICRTVVRFGLADFEKQHKYQGNIRPLQPSPNIARVILQFLHVLEPALQLSQLP